MSPEILKAVNEALAKRTLRPDLPEQPDEVRDAYADALLEMLDGLEFSLGPADGAWKGWASLPQMGVCVELSQFGKPVWLMGGRYLRMALPDVAEALRSRVEAEDVKFKALCAKADAERRGLWGK